MKKLKEHISKQLTPIPQDKAKRQGASELQGLSIMFAS
jgi:hypothetical protein